MTEQYDAEIDLSPNLSNIRVVLMETSHPGNVGSAARAMKTMGLSDLVLVAPKLAAPQRKQEAIALASGALDVLNNLRIVATLQEALADTIFAVGFTARKRELAHRHVDCREAADIVIKTVKDNAAQKVALVFGNEAMCLSNDDIDRCQLLASVPANPKYSSLNLAQTVQVAAYEMMMAAGKYHVVADAPRVTATNGEIEALMMHIEEAAVASGYLNPEFPKRFSTRLRRLFTRAEMEPEEVAMLRGLIASFQNVTVQKKN
jgi:tRNA/rRNA methyltransferase